MSASCSAPEMQSSRAVARRQFSRRQFSRRQFSRRQIIRATALCFALCFVLVHPVPAFADGGLLVPREVYVGDTAEFSFTATAFNSALEDGSVFVIPPADFPVTADLDIESIVIARRGDTSSITVRFVPWTAGIIKLPSITLKKIAVSPPPFRISSIVEKTGRKALEPPRSPLLVPGTTLLLYVFIALVIAAVAALVFAGVKIRRFLSGLSSGWASGRRIRILTRELAALSRSTGKKEMLVWYGEFSAAVRRYLGDLAEGKPLAFFPLTVTELLSSIVDAPDSLGELLFRVDAIRFSGHPFEDRRAGDIQLMRDLSAAFERAARERRENAAGDDIRSDGQEASRA